MKVALFLLGLVAASAQPGTVLSVENCPSSVDLGVSDNQDLRVSTTITDAGTQHSAEISVCEDGSNELVFTAESNAASTIVVDVTKNDFADLPVEEGTFTTAEGDQDDSGKKTFGATFAPRHLAKGSYEFCFSVVAGVTCAVPAPAEVPAGDAAGEANRRLLQDGTAIVSSGVHEVCITFNVKFWPEFIAPTPMDSSCVPEVAPAADGESGRRLLAYQESESETKCAPDFVFETTACADEEVKFTVKATDKNGGDDTVSIFVLEDPGIPNGASVGPHLCPARVVAPPPPPVLVGAGDDVRRRLLDEDSGRYDARDHVELRNEGNSEGQKWNLANGNYGCPADPIAEAPVPPVAPLVPTPPTKQEAPQATAGEDLRRRLLAGDESEGVPEAEPMAEEPDLEEGVSEEDAELWGLTWAGYKAEWDLYKAEFDLYLLDLAEYNSVPKPNWGSHLPQYKKFIGQDSDSEDSWTPDTYCHEPERVFSWKPNKSQAGRTYRVCFAVRDCTDCQVGGFYGYGYTDTTPGSFHANSQRALCVSIKVKAAKTQWMFPTPKEDAEPMTGVVGCENSWKVCAADLSNPGNKGYPVSLAVDPDTELKGRWNAGTAKNNPSNDHKCMTSSWTPSRGDEASTHTVCYGATGGAFCDGDLQDEGTYVKEIEAEGEEARRRLLDGGIELGGRQSKGNLHGDKEPTSLSELVGFVKSSSGFVRGSLYRCVSITVAKCVYCTQPGDTLHYLSKNYHLDTNWLRLWNSNGAPDALSKAGSRNLIHDPNQISESNELVNIGPRYKGQSGDSLVSIAKRFSTTVKVLLDVNPDIEPESNLEGEDICLLTCTSQWHW